MRGDVKSGDFRIDSGLGEVRKNVVIQPDDISLLKHEERPWLTFITCQEFSEKANTYRKQVVVLAMRVSVAKE